ncbi:Non-structural maintenance of chromosomes element 1 [Aphelenchoides avenae]|nr:Non-structural maintenance of chromosomes element 1 [Aphelenchus avenae]
MEELLQATREYGDAHRAMAQLLLKKHTLPVKSIGPVFKELCAHFKDKQIGESLNEEDKDTEKFLRILRKAFNDKISQVGLRIVDRYDELHRDEKSWILISELEHTEALANVDLKQDDLALFRLWMGLMLGTTAEGGAEQEEPTGAVTVNRALNAAPDNVSMKRAQELLAKLKDHQWLEEDKDAVGTPIIRLTGRAIAELEPMLSSGEFRVRACELCQKSIVYRWMTVECPECEGVFHASCVARYVDASTNGRAPCPGQVGPGVACGRRFRQQDVSNFAFDGTIP